MSGQYSSIEKEELEVWGKYAIDYFIEVLRGEKSLDVAREDLLSFRNSKYYTGTKEEYKYRLPAEVIE